MSNELAAERHYAECDPLGLDGDPNAVLSDADRWAAMTPDERQVMIEAEAVAFHAKVLSDQLASVSFYRSQLASPRYQRWMSLQAQRRVRHDLHTAETFALDYDSDFAGWAIERIAEEFRTVDDRIEDLRTDPLP